MAHAENGYREETKIIRHPVVVLTLSKAEAQTLKEMCSRVGGDPKTSPRKNSDSIGAALFELGFVSQPDHIVGIMGAMRYLDKDEQ